MKRCLLLETVGPPQTSDCGQVSARDLLSALEGLGFDVLCFNIFGNGPVNDQPGAAEKIAAANEAALLRLVALLKSFRPHVVQLQERWSWPILSRAFTGLPRPKIVYSGPWIGPIAPNPPRTACRSAAAVRVISEAQALEYEVWLASDLVLASSEFDRRHIESLTGREVAFVPSPGRRNGGQFQQKAASAGVKYAAVSGDGSQCEIDGFFDILPEGLGFLSLDEQIWSAGNIGPELKRDVRYRDFRSVNEPRLRFVTCSSDDDKVDFFSAASCVIIVPSVSAASNALDALSTGRVAVCTTRGIADFGSVALEAFNRGLFVAETPRAFRALVRRCLREGPPGCDDGIRARIEAARLRDRLQPLYGALFSGPAKPVSSV